MADNGSDIQKFETFINDYLKKDLAELDKHLNENNAEIVEFMQLKSMIEMIKTNMKDGFKTQVNVGGNCFIQAKVPNTDHIFMNIGKDIYMDFSLDEAIKYVEFRLRVHRKRDAIIREESIKKKAEIKLGLMCIAGKKKLYEEEKRNEFVVNVKPFYNEV